MLILISRAASASSTASTQKSASSVIDTRQARTRRENRSGTAAIEMRPHAKGKGSENDPGDRFPSAMAWRLTRSLAVGSIIFLCAVADRLAGRAGHRNRTPCPGEAA